MKTNTADSRARRAAPAIAVVGLLHLALLLALSQVGVRPDRQPVERQAPVWLQLLAPPRVAAPATPVRVATPIAAAPAPAPPATRQTAPALETREPVETTLFVAPEAPAAPPAEAPAPTEPPARPLNLSLPRGASAPYRHPALDDPRSNTLPPSLESRLAEVMGPSDGPITQEHMPDGSLRLRRGTRCAIVRPSRTAALDPFNLSVSPKPRQVDNC